MKYKIILASGSPRRKELLNSLGIEFTVIKPDVDEAGFDLDAQKPVEKVLFLSRVKAQAVFKNHPDAIVIGSDTIVWIDERILEKPKDEADAFAMLKALQNNTHTVYSGITVHHPDGRIVSDVLATHVTFKPMSDDEIHAYIKTGEPMDKAGAYAIQGHGSVLVKEINGCYFNVVGMSLYLLNQLFEELGETLNASSSASTLNI